jgi:exopolysaccharide biosynthesis polyprenyl glycosylphosphotransferase
MNKKKFLIKYILYDLVSAFIVWVLFTLFRKIVNDGLVFDTWFFVPNYDLLSSMCLFPLCCLFVHYLSGFYISPEKQTIISVALTTLVATAIISIVIFFTLMLDDIVVSYEYYYYSLLVLFGLLFFTTFISRLIISSEIIYNFKIKKWTINTIVVGNGMNALAIASEVEKKSSRNTISGFITTDNNIKVEKDRVLGNFQQIQSIIETNNIEEVIIALENPDEQKLFDYINVLYKYNVEIRFTPRLYEILTGSARFSTAGLNPIVSITQINMPDWQISIKRFFDIIISFIALILLIPVFLFFTIRIKRDSKGPVFYRQERIGRYGRPFSIVKFRTMYENSEINIPQLSSANDERITSVGRILRKYRIDELPQFWNVLRGDMSIVGPRPERKFYINQIVEEAPYYCLLYKIRPGLTSWGPIKIGYSDSIEKMIERLNYDIIYLENMSLFNDLRILILTVEIIFKGKGI